MKGLWAIVRSRLGELNRREHGPADRIKYLPFGPPRIKCAPDKVVLFPEVLEEIFLFLIFSDRQFRATMSTVMLVSHEWSAVMRRLEFVKVTVDNEEEADMFMDRFWAVKKAGSPRVLTRHLEVGTTSCFNRPVVRLDKLLKMVGPSLTYLDICGNRTTFALPTPERTLGLVQRRRHTLDACEIASSGHPNPPIDLPKLLTFRAGQIHVFDVITILAAARQTLRNISLYQSSVDLNPIIPVKLDQLVALHSLRKLALQDCHTAQEEFLRPFFSKSATSLEILEFHVPRAKLASATYWLRDEAPSSLKHVTVWIQAEPFDRLDGTVPEIVALYRLIKERNWTKQVMGLTPGSRPRPIGSQSVS